MATYLQSPFIKRLTFHTNTRRSSPPKKFKNVEIFSPGGLCSHHSSTSHTHMQLQDIIYVPVIKYSWFNCENASALMQP